MATAIGIEKQLSGRRVQHKAITGTFSQSRRIGAEADLVAFADGLCFVDQPCAERAGIKFEHVGTSKEIKNPVVTAALAGDDKDIISKSTRQAVVTQAAINPFGSISARQDIIPAGSLNQA